MLLSEFAMRIDKSLEHSDKDLIDVEKFFLAHGKVLKDIEDFKFKILQADDNLGLFSQDDKLIGFIQYSELESDVLELDKIFILKQYRNKKYAKMLLFWLKNLLNKDVYIGGSIFKDGQNLINSIIDDERFALIAYNKKLKERSKFNPTDFFNGKHYTGVILEQDNFSGYYDNSLPGEKRNSKMICLELFNTE